MSGIAMLAGIAALLAACAQPAPPSQPSSQPAPAAKAQGSAPAAAQPSKVEPVKYGTVPGFSSSGVYIAMERGYLQEVGIEIDLIPFGSGPEMIQPLTTEQIEVGMLDTGAGVLNALTRDLPLRFVADGNHYDKDQRSSAVVVRKDLVDSGAIKELSDLRGKQLSAIARGSLLDALAHQLPNRAGLQPEDIRIEYVGFAETLVAFANKGLDAAILVEPFVATAVDQDLGVRMWGTAELFGDFQGPILIYGPGITNQRQDVGRRFMVAYIRGARDFIDAFGQGKDWDTVVAALTKYTNVKDPALYRKMILPSIDPNGRINAQSIRELQRWYADNGFVSRIMPLDEFFDSSYVDHAVSVLGRR